MAQQSAKKSCRSQVELMEIKMLSNILWIQKNVLTLRLSSSFFVWQGSLARIFIPLPRHALHQNMQGEIVILCELMQ